MIDFFTQDHADLSLLKSALLKLLSSSILFSASTVLI